MSSQIFWLIICSVISFYFIQAVSDVQFHWLLHYITTLHILLIAAQLQAVHPSFQQSKSIPFQSTPAWYCIYLRLRDYTDNILSLRSAGCRIWSGKFWMLLWFFRIVNHHFSYHHDGPILRVLGYQIIITTYSVVIWPVFDNVQKDCFDCFRCNILQVYISTCQNNHNHYVHDLCSLCKISVILLWSLR